MDFNNAEMKIYLSPDEGQKPQAEGAAWGFHALAWNVLEAADFLPFLFWGRANHARAKPLQPFPLTTSLSQ